LSGNPGAKVVIREAKRVKLGGYQIYPWSRLRVTSGPDLDERVVQGVRVVKEARTAIFDWIQWYSRKRLHSSIDYVSPVQFEQASTIQAA